MGMGYTGEIWNQAGAQWNIQCDQALQSAEGNGGAGLAIFNNAGSITKSVTTGTTGFYPLLNKQRAGAGAKRHNCV